MTDPAIVRTFENSPRARSVLARPVLRRLADHWTEGSLTVDLPGQPGAIRLRGSEAGPQARWALNNWRAARRVLLRGDLGFAAGYLAGDWDTPDLPALLTGMATNYDNVAESLKGVRLVQAANAVLHALNRNTRTGSRRNILAHYDLGNDFYEAWLDPGMTYSSAIFHNAEEPLEAAQRRKYQRLAEIAAIGSGSRVLEIGCGWGGFARYAAEELGANVTAITLSPAQKSYADAQLARAGLSGQVDVRLMDYRDVAGQFDAIVSVEMFEAVG
jgi:cyclopropane-fatty-acyl-phospholipid synthase